MPIIDPVCRREIDDVEYPEQEDYKGKTYYFCSIEDAHAFRENPDKYVGEEEEEAADWSER